ncbi:MAG TPA: DUF2231 domain-containing protein, partial [Gemmatimonadaceae bacterium]|nr:DUF2231 domain-containing protein [Gemmatimonadaceae bacterium]
MESRARLLGHPIHQMLVVFPLGLLAGAAGFDVAHLLTGDGRWAETAWWLIGAGVVTALLAAPFGVIDWLAIPRKTRAKRVGLVHAGMNLLALLLFAVSWSLRRENPAAPPVEALICSFLAVTGSMVAAWFGGELVDRLGIGVSPTAHPDAPSSLSPRSAVPRTD